MVRQVTVTVALLALLAAHAVADAPDPLRPGDPLGNPPTCTLNFAFTDGATSYIGTAAHCVIADQVVTNQAHGRFGVVDRMLPDVDFALIRLDPDEAVDPRMREFSGPTGVATREDTETGDVLATYGHGLAVGLAVETRPRLGVHVGESSTEFWWDTVTSPGDSGAPVVERDTGRAVGIVAAVGVLAHESTDVGPRLEHVLKRLAETGRPVRLVTAPAQG